MDRQQPQTDWTSVADKVAKVPNPMYVNRAGSPGYVGLHEHPGQTGPTGTVGHGPTRTLGKTGPHLLMGPPWLPGPPGTPGQPESSSCPVGPQKQPDEKGPIRSVSHFPTGPSGPLGKTGAQGAMPRQQPETDWISVADAGANISNPMYFTGSDDFRVDCELCRHWGLSRRTGAKQNCAGGVEERRGQSRFFAGAKQNGAGAKQNGGGEEEGGMLGCMNIQEKRGPKGPHRLMSPPGPLGQPRSSPYPSMPAENSQPFGKSMSNEPYIRWQGTCYKIFNTQKNFNDANETCHRDNGTLAMPRDAETNDFLTSLKKSGSYPTWLGLHDKREEGRFEWMDGSPLGKYNSWHPGQPNGRHVTEDCVFMHVGVGPTCGQWWDEFCWRGKYFFCQVALETGAMPGHQPQTDFRLVADKAANVPNPMYGSKAGKMPRHRAQTDWMSVADKAASIPNSSYVSRAVKVSCHSEEMAELSAEVIKLNNWTKQRSRATEPQEHQGQTRPKWPVGHGPTGPSGPPGKTGAQGLTSPPRPNGPPEQHGHPGSTFRPTGPPEQYQTSGKPESNKRSCPAAYTRWQGTCYKVFNTRKNFNDAKTTCHKDGGSLAMPRDAETNDFLGSLVRSDCTYRIGLHDRREEESFKWVDGSALGTYNAWRPGTRPVAGQSPVLTRAACGRVPTGSYSSAGQLSGPWRVPGGIPTGSSRVFEQEYTSSKEYTEVGDAAFSATCKQLTSPSEIEIGDNLQVGLLALVAEEERQAELAGACSAARRVPGSEVMASLRRISPNGARSDFNSELKLIRRPRGAKNRPATVGKPAGLRPGPVR
ncbi:hypothetical protein Bbelb_082900 [Branchiostoma belcheri]|nr:hypothetical protein Bbelb_082900 [Branchiostoma belcheri]